MTQDQTTATISSDIITYLTASASNTFLIRGDLITDKDSFFIEFSTALNFPNYWGKNWDAFYDCLTDLSWLDNQEVTIIIYENTYNFQSNNNEDWNIASNALLEAIDYWKQQHKPMIVIFT